MKRITIISFVEKFKFPLHEALQKQIWWTAIKYKKLNYEVEIILFVKNQTNYIKNGITVKFIRKYLPFEVLCIKNDVLVITNVVSYGLLLFYLLFRTKKLILTDGSILTNSKFRKFISYLLPDCFKKIYVYSKYQKNEINFHNVYVISPILPKITNTNIKASSVIPSIFYMGHLTKVKGVDIILEAYEKILLCGFKYKLILANNSVRGIDKNIKLQLDYLKEKYGELIILKGIVDPIKELSSASLYLYPFMNPLGTMSFPLSIYESIKCNTPYIANRIGANREFFENKYLVEPNDSEKLKNKIIEILDDREIKRNLQTRLYTLPDIY